MQREKGHTRHIKNCPHCRHGFTGFFPVTPVTVPDGPRAEQLDAVAATVCPNCNKITMYFGQRQVHMSQGNVQRAEVLNNPELVWPRGAAPRPLPAEVPDPYASEFRQSVACLDDAKSPMASAALSRRCLQNVLLNHCGIQKKDLDKEIQEVIDSGKFPQALAESLDAVRTIGNFAAHPIKSQSTGLVVEVEPGEAEWLLDVLEELFDFAFVQPARLAAKRAALNAKLVDAGKRELKKASP